MDSAPQLPADLIDVSHVMALSDSALDDRLDQAWEAHATARSEIVLCTAAQILRTVREHLPAAATVVLREDTSHLPAHGHVDAVLDAHGRPLADTSGEDWHDLDWTHPVDEAAWDIHAMAAFLFRGGDDGVRRLVIGAPADRT